MVNDKLSTSNSRGATLIELLLVTVIISIIMGISFLGYRQRGEELGLQRAAFKVMADIEKTRELAMSAHELESIGQVPEGGYGIYFNTATIDSYIIFADLGPVDREYTGSSESVETIDLEEKIKISGLNPGNPVNIVFLPPSPDVYLQGGTAVSEVDIVIALTSNPSKTKTIYLNRAGLVSVGD